VYKAELWPQVNQYLQCLTIGNKALFSNHPSHHAPKYPMLHFNGALKSGKSSVCKIQDLTLPSGNEVARRRAGGGEPETQ